MRLQVFLGIVAASVLFAQESKPPANEPQGIPPRAAPTDYQAQAKAGEVTIGAEFTGHAIPTADGPLNSDDFVAVEAAIFGSGKLQFSYRDFSIRINGKKSPTPAEPYGLVIESVNDPEWAPPEKHDKPKTTIGGGGAGQGASSAPPPAVKVPIEVQRAMAQRVKKASMPEGDRALPQAGLLFFPYKGKAKGIHSIELIYSGPAGSATLTLQP